jgi:hypothetical protein
MYTSEPEPKWKLFGCETGSFTVTQPSITITVAAKIITNGCDTMTQKTGRTANKQTPETYYHISP